MPLSDLPAGRRGQITRVVDQPDLLRYLDTLKMTLGSQVEVTERAPFDGPLHVVVDDRMPAHALSQVVTDQVYVAPVEK
jgi:DtxR family Mn-dependent transcriptional regulator